MFAKWRLIEPAAAALAGAALAAGTARGGAWSPTALSKPMAAGAPESQAALRAACSDMLGLWPRPAVFAKWRLIEPAAAASAGE